MRTVATTAALTLLLGIAGCTQQPNPPIQAVTPANPAGNTGGSMAYPTPLPSGEFQRPAVTGRDTGNMSMPTVSRPGISTPVGPTGPTDTGNMAYPNPLPAGRITH